MNNAINLTPLEADSLAVAIGDYIERTEAYASDGGEELDPSDKKTINALTRVLRKIYSATEGNA